MNKQNTNIIPGTSGDFRLLTVDGYAEQFGVCRTTVFEWKRNGILVEGRHFIKIGKILRFFWGLDVIRDIVNYGSQQPNPSKSSSEISTQKLSINKRKNRINIDY